jgi:hypothetical protein
MSETPVKIAFPKISITCLPMFGPKPPCAREKNQHRWVARRGCRRTTSDQFVFVPQSVGGSDRPERLHGDLPTGRTQCRSTLLWKDDPVAVNQAAVRRARRQRFLIMNRWVATLIVGILLIGAASSGFPQAFSITGRITTELDSADHADRLQVRSK